MGRQRNLWDRFGLTKRLNKPWTRLSDNLLKLENEAGFLSFEQ